MPSYKVHFYYLVEYADNPMHGKAQAIQTLDKPHSQMYCYFDRVEEAE